MHAQECLFLDLFHNPVSFIGSFVVIENDWSLTISRNDLTVWLCDGKTLHIIIFGVDFIPF